MDIMPSLSFDLPGSRLELSGIQSYVDRIRSPAIVIAAFMNQRVRLERSLHTDCQSCCKKSLFPQWLFVLSAQFVSAVLTAPLMASISDTSRSFEIESQ